MPMQAKCSMHCGGKYSIEHNLRQYDETKWNLDNHISSDRRFLNVTLANIELRTFIDEQFGDALVVANEKNRKRHPDRLIGFKDKYDYDSCPIEERRERAVNAYYREQRKNVQEMIVQLGDHKNYLEMVEIHGRTKADRIYSDYLQQAYNEFVTKNPSLKVFCATVHMDEIRDGTPHLHIDYLPVAESSRGMTRKVSMDGALKQLGFEREKEQKYAETPYKQWLRSRREGFEDFAQQYCNDNKLDIVILPSEKSVAKHEEPQLYKARQSRVKSSRGRIADLTGKNKKDQIAAAEYIISNANAVKESIIEDAAQQREELHRKEMAAQLVLKDKDAAEQLRRENEKKANALTRTEMALNEREQRIDEDIEQGVENRIQSIFRGIETGKSYRLQEFCESLVYPDGKSVLDLFEEQEQELKEELLDKTQRTKDRGIKF